MVTVGKKAGFYRRRRIRRGKFIEVKLSEYLGKVGRPLLLPG